MWLTLIPLRTQKRGGRKDSQTQSKKASHLYQYLFNLI